VARGFLWVEKLLSTIGHPQEYLPTLWTFCVSWYKLYVGFFWILKCINVILHSMVVKIFKNEIRERTCLILYFKRYFGANK
jgi:hypothetical protein